MFFIYAFIGWVIEVIYYGITEGRFINRGFLNGPLCPVYGIGFYCVIALFLPFQDNVAIIFFGGMAIATLVEYFAGLILYKLFSLRWWDYSNYKLNLQGFICLQFSIYWGIACMLGMKILHPSVLFILDKIPDAVQWVILGIFIALLLADLINTVITIIGFKKKLILLTDLTSEIKNVSDKIGSQIYGGVETVKTKTTPVVEGLNVYREMYTANRNAERELFRKNRSKEKEYLEKMILQQKDIMKNTSIKLPEGKVNEMFSGMKKREEQLLTRIVASKNDAYRGVLTLLKIERDKDTKNIIDEEKEEETV